MAKKSIVERELKRRKLYEKHLSKRQEIESKLRDSKITEEEKWKLRMALQKLPRNSSRVRHTRRCMLTGRAHSVYARFGLSRIKLREYAMRGEVPGIIRSSW